MSEKATHKEQQEEVCVLLQNHVPEEITLGRASTSSFFKLIMAIDGKEIFAVQETMNSGGTAQVQIWGEQIFRKSHFQSEETYANQF